MLTVKNDQPVVVAFLQNLWFRNPERMKLIYDKYIAREEPGKGRQRFIRDFLFFGCLTGKRLDAAFEPVFGDQWRRRIVWEESHQQWGGESSACFEYDADHMRQVMLDHKPDVVMLFGKVALGGWKAGKLETATDRRLVIIEGPHPAARGADVPIQLRHMAYVLQSEMAG